jgi:hypothetical protein
MNRRAFIAAPAAIAAMPAAASAVEAQRPPWAPDAIRERIALVVEAFSRAVAALTSPLSDKLACRQNHQAFRLHIHNRP